MHRSVAANHFFECAAVASSRRSLAFSVAQPVAPSVYGWRTRIVPGAGELVPNPTGCRLKHVDSASKADSKEDDFSMVREWAGHPAADRAGGVETVGSIRFGNRAMRREPQAGAGS
jgi:hypothetical protein